MNQPSDAPGHLPRTRKVVVVADDFTGAAESAAVFVASPTARSGAAYGKGGGGCVAVPIFLPASQGHPSRGVCALDTESRNVSREESLRRIEHTLIPWARSTKRARSHPQHEPIWFKKVDSTLRGHVGDETFRMMDLLGLENAIVAPALPDEGRTTEGGVQLVDGVPAASSHARQDVFAATKDDTIVRIFERSAWAPPTLLSALALGADAAQASRIIESSFRVSRILVIDASTNEELMWIAAGALLLQRKHVLVGSAGLARAVAWALSPHQTASRQPADGAARKDRNPRSMSGILVVRGSPHPNSMQQTARLLEVTGMARYTLGTQDRAEPGNLFSLLAHKGLVLEAPVAHDAPTSRQAAADIGGHLADQVGQLIEGAAVRGLVVAGGDTAHRILKRIGVRRLVTFGEAARNLPMSRFRIRGGTRTVLVTKAGGFGRTDTMLEAATAAARAVASLGQPRDV